MIKKTDIKFIAAIDTGVMDLDAMRHNFDNIQEVVDEHADEMNALASKQTQTISFGIEEAGLTTILSSNKHLRIKIVNAFIQVGDNLNLDNVVELKGISNSIKISSGEKAGKIRMLNILKNHLMFHESIVVETSSDRRIIVNVTYESTEDGN